MVKLYEPAPPPCLYVALLRGLGGGTLHLLGKLEEGFAWGGHFDECAEARCLLLDRAKKNIIDDICFLGLGRR